MEKNTYIASNNENNLFFIDRNTYIASNQHNSSEDILMPVSIFRKGLSGLEAISKYLKDNLGLRFCDIASMINRDDRTIWNAYSSAKKKCEEEAEEEFLVEESNYSIPLSMFNDRMLSVLEIITCYLKESFGLKYSEIASLINKNDRTVWTVYNRAQKKRRNVQNN